MLAPEGKTIVTGSAIVTIIFGFVWSWSDLFIFHLSTLLGVLFVIFCLYFFRDPQRIIPEGENLILSPADGKVVFVGTTQCDDFGDIEYKQVSIFLSIFNVHVNRVPISGEVTRVKYRKGMFKAAFFSEASDVNEHTEIDIKVDDKVIRVKQIAGLIARRILCYMNKGDKVTRGDRLGFIRFGSRMDVLVPSDTKLTVKVGEKVKGGVTIIGEII